MDCKYPPREVAEAFVQQYYYVLRKYPDILHEFYNDLSQMQWQRPYGEVKPVTTLEGIHGKISSTDYNLCKVEIETVDSQKSLRGSVFVMVTGYFTWPNAEKKKFSQAFFLAEQPTGYFILNDILRVSDILGTKIDSPLKNAGKSDHTTVTKKSDENPIHSVDGSSNDKLLSSPKALTTTEGTEIVAPRSSEDNRSAVSAETSTATPAKFSYASVLSRETPVTTPRSPKITSDVQKQHVDSPKAKPVTSEEKIVPKSPPARNPASRAEGSNSIFIGRLPFDVTKQEIRSVLKQFGAIKRDSNSIQIRRREDGFVCGFVDFETAESAELAVKTHRVQFRNKQTFISHRRSPNFQETRGQFPTGVSPRKSWENEGTTYQAKLPIRTENRPDTRRLRGTTDDGWLRPSRTR